MISTEKRGTGGGGVDELFDSVAAADEAAHRRLHAALTERAQADGLLDVAYRTIDTPVGPLLVATTEQGLVRVAYACQGHEEVLATLADRISPRVLSAPGRLDTVAREMEEYFVGSRTRFDLPIDYRLSAGFRRQVLDHLVDIAYGATASYAAVASLAGSPRAVRAVGSACATNPLPVVIPCHRVIRSDGTPGGYAGGQAAKLTLLALESRLESR